jgi:hypothetical protein
MTTSDDPSTDALIRADLAALASATTVSDGELGALRERLLGSGAPYRDGQLGIEQRRHAALEDRRIQLALLPLVLQRLFVHRVGRAVGGGVAVLCGLALWASVILPTLFGVYIVMHPRMTIDLALIGAIAGVLTGYVVGIFVGERALERAVRASITPTWDALRDIDRDGPAVEARRLAGRMDSFAVGLPLVGVALLVPLLVFVSVLYLDGVRAVYSDLLYLNDAGGLLKRNIGYVAVAVMFAALLAVEVSWGSSRERSWIAKGLSHWSVLAGGLLLGLVVLVLGGRAFFELYVNGISPSSTARWSLALGGVAALFLPCAWALLALRRREQRLLEEQAE